MKLTYIVSFTTAWINGMIKTPEQFVAELRRRGLGIELWDLWGPYTDLYNRVHWDRWKTALQNIPAAIHAQYTVKLPYPDDFDRLESMKSQIEFSSHIGAQTLIVHGFHLSPSTEDYRIEDHGMAAEIIAYAEDRGVTLALENGSLPMLEEVFDRHPSVKFCLDTGHAGISEDPFEAFVDLMKSRLCHLHIADNRGFDDDHKPPGIRHGLGEDRWRYLLDAMHECDFEGLACIELTSGGISHPWLREWAIGLDDYIIEESLDFLTEEIGFNPPPQRTKPYAQSPRDPSWNRAAAPDSSRLNLELEYVAGFTVAHKSACEMDIEYVMRDIKRLGVGFEISDTLCNKKGYFDIEFWDRWTAACDGMLNTVCGAKTNDSPWEDIRHQLDFCKYVKSNLYILQTEQISETAGGMFTIDHDLLAKALDYANDRCIRVALENGSPTILQEALDHHTTLGMCFDSGSARLDKSHSFREILELFKHRMIHLHIHDNRGINNDRQPPGIYGGLPVEDWHYLADTLVEIDYRGVVCIETSPFHWEYAIDISMDYLSHVCHWPAHEP